ncbi:MAG: hypothetical protein ACRC28_06055 [Clostridium sp.]|uniref:hypothetical protein n=1 Tax=Clostridium sp. TaxID=1506 RepID=UPI003F36ADEB
MKKHKFPLIPTVISIGIILAIISVIAYYFIYQDSVVVTAVNNSKTALENGQLQTAISDLSNVDTITYADNKLVQTQEVAIQNFKNISTQYNEAISDMNNSNYPECLSILNSLHTNNKYLNERIKNALSISNTGYAQLLYKEGIQALQADDSQAAASYYNTLSSKYPNSPFTKQLEAYLNGTAKGTIHSLNIEISRPMISPIGSTPTPAPQTDAVVTPFVQNATTSTVSNASQNLENSNSEIQNNSEQNSNTNSSSNQSTQSTSISSSDSNSSATSQTEEPAPASTSQSVSSNQSNSSSSSSDSSSNTQSSNATPVKASNKGVSQTSTSSETHTVQTKEAQKN